jgi:hypothetical protein
MNLEQMFQLEGSSFHTMNHHYLIHPFPRDEFRIDRLMIAYHQKSHLLRRFGTFFFLGPGGAYLGSLL